MVNAGVKVLLTTHSDYLIKEINNLIMLGHSFRNKAKVIKRLKYGEDDHLGPDRIRAYIAKKNNKSVVRCLCWSISAPYAKSSGRLHSTESRMQAGYLVICENRRLNKQTMRAEPVKTAYSEEYKDITVRTYIGTTISLAILTGVSPD